MELLGRRPVGVALLGAMVIAFSGPLVRLAEVPPATAAFFRCLLALPVLLLLARREDRRHGALPTRTKRTAALAGVFFAADLILWHHAIDAVGAGLATVLGNLQVLVVASVAWWLLGERPRAGVLAAVPALIAGVVLISGVLGGGTYGRDPRLGVLLGLVTSVAYAGFILVLRHGSSDLRRIAGPLLWATASAAVTAGLAGLALGELVLPAPRSLLWLVVLALSAQVCGWLLISSALPRLPAALTAVLLLVQPVGALAISALLLAETPSLVQYAGAACILSGVVLATAGSGRAVEKARHRTVLEDLTDGPSNQRRDRQDRQPVEALAGPDGQRVGDDDVVDPAVLEPVHSPA